MEPAGLSALQIPMTIGVGIRSQRRHQLTTLDLRGHVVELDFGSRAASSCLRPSSVFDSSCSRPR